MVQASVVVELEGRCPVVGGCFRSVVALPNFNEATDKPCDEKGPRERLHTPERVEVVLAAQEGRDAREDPVLPLAGQVPYEAVLGNVIRPW